MQAQRAGAVYPRSHRVRARAGCRQSSSADQPRVLTMACLASSHPGQGGTLWQRTQACVTVQCPRLAKQALASRSLVVSVLSSVFCAGEVEAQNAVAQRLCCLHSPFRSDAWGALALW